MDDHEINNNSIFKLGDFGHVSAAIKSYGDI